MKLNIRYPQFKKVNIMFKKICTILILSSTVIISSQNITLLKNNNPKAKELNHSLNSTKDSLILESEKPIYKIEIFNEDFEKIVVVKDFEVQIPLFDLPVGRFIVHAKLTDRILVMELIKHEVSNSTVTLDKIEIAEGKGMMLDEKLNIIKSSPNKSIEFILTRGKTKKRATKNQKFYWTVTKINNEIGSSKTMRLVNQESVDRMILKNKLEYSSTEGKLNELIAWEVYNTEKFIKHQVSDNNYMYSQASDFFNTSPYYTSANNLQNP